MKKILTILLALALCLALLTCVAEEKKLVIGQVFWACTIPISTHTKYRPRNIAMNWASNSSRSTAR